MNSAREAMVSEKAMAELRGLVAKWRKEVADLYAKAARR